MPALKSIAEHFANADIILADGQLNRPLLRQIIFADAEEKLWLETSITPIDPRLDYGPAASCTDRLCDSGIATAI